MLVADQRTAEKGTETVTWSLIQRGRRRRIAARVRQIADRHRGILGGHAGQGQVVGYRRLDLRRRTPLKAPRSAGWVFSSRPRR